MAMLVFTSQISAAQAEQLLDRVAKGEPVTAEERLAVIKSLVAFSPRDWAADPELWLLYRVALNEKGDPR